MRSRVSPTCVLTELRAVFAVQRARRALHQVQLLTEISYPATGAEQIAGHLMPNRSPVSSSVLLVGISHNRPATGCDLRRHSNP
jgi:hypothetical protein